VELAESCWLGGHGTQIENHRVHRNPGSGCSPVCPRQARGQDNSLIRFSPKFTRSSTEERFPWPSVPVRVHSRPGDALVARTARGAWCIFTGRMASHTSVSQWCMVAQDDKGIVLSSRHKVRFIDQTNDGAIRQRRGKYDVCRERISPNARHDHRTAPHLSTCLVYSGSARLRLLPLFSANLSQSRCYDNS